MNNAASINPTDKAVESWMTRMGAGPRLALLAAWVSYAHRQSHAGVPLEILNQWSGETFSLEDLDSPLVARDEQLRLDPQARQPLVVDGKSRVFLYRNFAAELQVAQHLRARMSHADSAQVAESVITQLFGPETADGADRQQRAAVRTAAGKRLFVLAGGPGTGKTTTVFRMLMAAGYGPADVSLAAPTGKAAQRLTEALRNEANAAAEHANGLETLRAMTVHRWLIEMRNGSLATPRALVIDEASMLDLPLLAAVLEQLSDESALILVGDPNQLMSVGTGTVLGDLVAALGGSESMVELTHNFRVAGSPELVALNAAALNGDGARMESLLGGLVDVQSRSVRDKQLKRFANELAGDLRRVRDASQGTAADQRASAHFDMVRERQLLTALREGSYGARAINADIDALLAQDAAPHGAHGAWFEGRRVLITENHYGLGLFNGDVGVCTVDGAQADVWFESIGEDGALVPKRVPVTALPSYELAWAMTIHKSQGSEFKRIAIVLPPTAESRILSRQLLYTGVSRAKAAAGVRAAEAVSVWGSAAVLQAGLGNEAMRYGGLQDLLQS